MRGLREKRVLITGGAGGIGAATALRFLDEGARVAVLDKDPQGLLQIQKSLPGVEKTLLADVSISQEVEAAFAELDNHWGGLDVLINNAGISIRHRFLEIEDKDWLNVIAINLTGVFFCARSAAKRMVRQKDDGVIINMGSTNGLIGYPFYASYNSSKAGVIELTRSMALELAPGIRVNAVCPGYVLTPMQETEYTPEMLGECERKVPLGRLGKPEEVAGLFAFLASDDAKFITGQCFVIDGGELAGGLASWPWK
jgi:meso-butanediol dehydrogenase / (S,S)-butanediol dehydrogenase / diacetyl reductase